ncbi:MAG: hypothetical protein JW704_00545 [Anaerolineaceae bacterium]|nr:hypothetical protein [Anaerolineaceae bacterium]MBN2678164.1 hypothetical protein [Anaerolineaceae bacterium]
MKKPLLTILIVLSLAGCWLVWSAGSTYGAGLSSDAVRIISTGQNFVAGRGLIMSSGAPLIFCPPYYSILLGVLSIIFHSDVFSAGMYLNILAFGAIIFCSGQLFALIKPGKALYIVLGSLVVFSSPSLIKISANVAPDPLFILFVIVFLYTAIKYVRTPSLRNWSGMLISALLAASQRYLGLTVVLAGAVVILWQHRRKPWTALRSTALFALLSSAPTLAYILLHNYLGYGTLTGPRFSPWPSGNIRIFIEKVTHWFIPGSITLKTGIWAWVCIGLVLLLAGLLLAWKNGRLKRTSFSDDLIPLIAFSFFYVMMLIFMVSYKEHRSLPVDRIHIVMLVPLLTLLFELLPLITPPPLANHGRRSIFLLLLVFGIWLVYPGFSNYRYIINSLQDGEASPYNIHNTGPIRESELARYMEEHPFPENARLYSNYNETAWFLTRKQVNGIPTEKKAGYWLDIDEVTYLIWFDLPELAYMPKSMMTLGEISQAVALEQVFSGKDGGIYRLVATYP